MPDDYIPFSAGWFTLSLINAGLAQSKGRSGLGWWAVSLLLGPLATLIIVAWPPVAPGEGEFTRGGLAPALLVVIAVVLLLGLFAIFATLGAGTPS